MIRDDDTIVQIDEAGGSNEWLVGCRKGGMRGVIGLPHLPMI